MRQRFTLVWLLQELFDAARSVSTCMLRAAYRVTKEKMGYLEQAAFSLHRRTIHGVVPDFIAFKDNGQMLFGAMLALAQSAIFLLYVQAEQYGYPD